MRLELEIDFIWIPPSVGGRGQPPYQGLRTSLRWQRYLREHLERLRDAEMTEVSYDPATRLGVASLRLVADDLPPAAWLEAGNLVELVDGYQVIAIGRIRATSAGPPGSLSE